MARRRAVGRGISRASDSISGLIDAYIKGAFLEDSQRRQNELISRRQRELSAQGHRQNLTERFVANPNDVNRLLMNEQTDVAGVPLEPYRPTVGELQAPTLKQILDAKSLTELPPELAARVQGQNSGLAQMGDDGMTGIDELLKVHAAKRNDLMTEANVAEGYKERMGPGNVKGIVARDGTFLPQERTGAQSGMYKLDELRTGEGSPEGIRIKGDMAQEEASGRAMGAVLGEHAVLPEVIELEKAKARAQAQGRAGAVGTIAQILPAAQRIIELARKLNTTKRADNPTVWGDLRHAMVNRFGGNVELLRQSNPDLNELHRLVEGMTITFTGLLGHVGVKTQKDVDSTKMIIPNWGMYNEDSERTITNFSKLIATAMEMGEMMGPIDQNLPQELQSAEYQRRLGLVLAASGVDAPAQTQPNNSNVVPYNQLFPQ